MSFGISYPQMARGFLPLNVTSKHNALFLVACLFIGSWTHDQGVHLWQCDRPVGKYFWSQRYPLDQTMKQFVLSEYF